MYQFLGMDATNYKFGMFCQQCHPSVASVDADIRPRNASRIHTRHLFTSQFCLYLQFGESGRQIPRPKLLSSEILFSIVMPTFGKSCRRPWLHGLKNHNDNSLTLARRQAIVWTYLVCWLVYWSIYVSISLNELTPRGRVIHMNIYIYIHIYICVHQ